MCTCSGVANVLQLSSVIPGDGLWENVTVQDVMDTVGGKPCYTYARCSPCLPPLCSNFYKQTVSGAVGFRTQHFDSSTFCPYRNRTCCGGYPLPLVPVFQRVAKR